MLHQLNYKIALYDYEVVAVHVRIDWQFNGNELQVYAFLALLYIHNIILVSWQCLEWGLTTFHDLFSLTTLY